jgi:hypothetical protein
MYQHAAELWKKYGTLVKTGVAAAGPQGASVAAAIEISEQLGNTWNKLVGNSSLKVGPRYLFPNRLETGTVILGTERTFISSALSADSRVVFKKVDGDAAGTIILCIFNERGEHQDLKRFVLPKNSKDGTTFQASVPKNHVVSVRIDSDSELKKLSYSLRLDLD